MNKCLIFGSTGFIGSYLVDFLSEKKLDIYGTTYQQPEEINKNYALYECDIGNRDHVEEVVTEIKPDFIFFLAAQSLVAPSFKDPEHTLRTNILGTLYVLEAIRKARIYPVVEVFSSSAVYGINYENEIPIKENKEFRPVNPYAVSKIGTDMLAYMYWQTYKMKIIRVRPFNITGPRRTQDVCSDFARQIVEMEKGRRKVMEVGNLEPVRDITDIRDAVKAAWLLAEKGKPGEAYNICAGRGYKISEILYKLLSMSSEKIEVRQDPAKMRPSDDLLQIGDNSKLRELGWKPEIPIEKTLADMVDYWRNNI